MKNISLIALILAVAAGLALAQECPSGCEVAGAAKTKVTVAAKVEKLQKSADKGCQTSKDLLAKLQKEFKADSPEQLIKMAATCEQFAANGCEVSKKMLAQIDGELAKKKSQPVSLSMRLARLEKGCAKGCAKSTTLMASLVKEYEAADSKALILMVAGWEKKAANGCEKCVGKLATLSAQLPSKKPALSVRLASLDKGCANGCEKSKAKMAALVKEYDAADSKALILMVAGWETKAANGCQKCVGKLSTLSASLAPAAKAETKAIAKSVDAECTGCDDCNGACKGCDSK